MGGLSGVTKLNSLDLVNTPIEILRSSANGPWIETPKT